MKSVAIAWLFLAIAVMSVGVAVAVPFSRSFAGTFDQHTAVSLEDGASVAPPSTIPPEMPASFRDEVQLACSPLGAAFSYCEGE